MEPSGLFRAFREDHAVLGRGFFEISAHLRSGHVAGARDRAERLDREAGSHIGFEEAVLYPALRRLLGDTEVDRLYQEHGEGLAVIRGLGALPNDATLSEDERLGLLRRSEAMESHVAECSELFGLMGRIPPGEQAALYGALRKWRDEAPRWTALGNESRTGRAES